MTIELHSNLLNSMAGKLSSLLDKLTGQDTTLKDLQSACKTISSDEIDLSEVVTNIQNSSDSQGEQKKKLQRLKEKVENFIDKAEQVDTDVKDLINRRKDEFYKAHYNLKPYSEMGFWEKRWDNLKKVGQWCKEHWKLVVTIVIVIVSIALICTGVGGILGAMALGALFGTIIGGIAGGTISALSGGSFWEGAENGAFSGAIAGIISGGMGFAFSASGTVALSFGQTLLIGGASGIGTSFLNDVGDKYIKGDNISWGQIGFNALFSGVVSTAFAGIGFGLSKILGTVFKNSSFLSKGRELFRFGKTSNPDYGRITSYTTPNTSGVTLNFANNVGKSVFRIEFDSSMFLHYHFSSLLGTKAHIPLSPILDSSVSVNISKFFKEKFGEWFK